jgi:hypothetical protein
VVLSCSWGDRLGRNDLIISLTQVLKGVEGVRAVAWLNYRPNEWAVYQSKPLESGIHRFEESEYERRGDVRARWAVT